MTGSHIQGNGDAILRGVLFNFSREANQWMRGFCQDFWKKIRSVCDVVKPLGFQKRRNLIFF